MKKYILAAIMIFAAHFLWAQARPYTVVFDLTSGDTAEHKTVIRWLNLILSGTPDAKLEVVFYGKSLDMVTNNKSAVAEDVKKLATNKNVAFRVCEIAMKRQNIAKDQLIPGVGTVPDGIYEIISKQGEGWGYIKVAH